MFATILRALAPGRTRQLGKAENAFVSIIAVLTSAFFLTLAFGVYVNSQYALNWFLGAILAVAFLTTTGNPDRPTGRSVFSWAAAAASIGILVYFTAMQPVYEMRLPMIDGLTLADQIAGVALILSFLKPRGAASA